MKVETRPVSTRRPGREPTEVSGQEPIAGPPRAEGFPSGVTRRHRVAGDVGRGRLGAPPSGSRAIAPPAWGGRTRGFLFLSAESSSRVPGLARAVERVDFFRPKELWNARTVEVSSRAPALTISTSSPAGQAPGDRRAVKWSNMNGTPGDTRAHVRGVGGELVEARSSGAGPSPSPGAAAAGSDRRCRRRATGKWRPSGSPRGGCPWRSVTSAASFTSCTSVVNVALGSPLVGRRSLLQGTARRRKNCAPARRRARRRWPRPAEQSSPRRPPREAGRRHRR